MLPSRRAVKNNFILQPDGSSDPPIVDGTFPKFRMLTVVVHATSVKDRGHRFGPIRL